MSKKLLFEVNRLVGWFGVNSVLQHSFSLICLFLYRALPIHKKEDIDKDLDSVKEWMAKEKKDEL